MNWLHWLRRQLSRPAPAPLQQRVYANPLDLVLAASLQGRAVPTVELLAAYPTLTPAEVEALAPRLAELHEQAMTLGSLVNRQELDQNTAYDRLWQAYPELDRGNLGSLLWQAFVGTR